MTGTGRGGKAIVVGNGRCPDRNGLPAGALDGARLVVAADGGYRTALALGLRPDGVVGDGDSLGPTDRFAIEERGIAFRRVAPEKDESDLELAVADALAAGVDRIVIVGALDGPRIEHTLANLLLLVSPTLEEVDVAVVDDRSTIRGMRAGDRARSLSLSGRPGDYLSLFAVGGNAAEVTTNGLKYPLSAEPLAVGASRGLSNEFVAEEASVTVRDGVLLVVHTPRRAAEATPAQRGGEETSRGTS